MVEICREHMTPWRDGDERNMAQEMMAMTLDITVKTLFGASLPAEAHKVGEAMIYLMRFSMRRQRLPLRIPEHWPTPKNRRATRELEFMDSIIYRVISSPLAAGGEKILSRTTITRPEVTRATTTTRTTTTTCSIC